MVIQCMKSWSGRGWGVTSIVTDVIHTCRPDNNDYVKIFSKYSKREMSHVYTTTLKYLCQLFLFSYLFDFVSFFLGIQWTPAFQINKWTVEFFIYICTLKWTFELNQLWNIFACFLCSINSEQYSNVRTLPTHPLPD